tara:strand:+ start:4337 stop:4897 length:561 start_codon:yes stop_codon:yes gene_type:complete
MTLPAETIEQLENILFSEEVTEEALDYFGLHGLICSAVVGPIKIKNDRIIEIIFGNEKPHLKNEDEQFLNKVIEDISLSIKEQLLDESDIYLPYSAEHEIEQSGHYDACIESWCVGFMEGFFDNEETWFAKGEDVAAELLLPIMALSGLFESDEFEDIRENDKLMTQFEEVMPDQLVDIFLFYHSE